MNVEQAARLDVTKAAARRMLDTDEHFFMVLARWLINAAGSEAAYRIAEAYLESEPRLRRWA